MATLTITQSGESKTLTIATGVGPAGSDGAAGPAPSGTGLVSVTSGVLDTPSTLSARVSADASNLRTQLGLGTAATVNTGTAEGAIPVRGTGGRLTAGSADSASDASLMAKDNLSVHTTPYGNPEIRVQAGEEVSYIYIESETSSLIFLAAENQTGSGGSGGLEPFLHIRYSGDHASQNYAPIASHMLLLKDTTSSPDTWRLNGSIWKDSATGDLVFKKSSVDYRVSLVTASETLSNKTLTSPTITGTLTHGSGTWTGSTFTGAQTFSSAPILSTLTASSMVYADASKNLVTPTLAQLQAASGIQVKKSSAQIDVTSSATFTDITGLTAYSLEADTVYRVEFFGSVTAGASGGYKIQINSTTAFFHTTAGSQGLGTFWQTAGSAGIPFQLDSTNIQINSRTAASTALPVSTIIFIRTNTASTVKFQFAQNISNATTSSLLAGAVASITKLI